MSNPKLPVTLRAQTGARLYGPIDCSAHVRSRWSFDRTTAVSPKYAELFHLRTGLERRRFASNTQLNPLAEAQASISRPAVLHLSLYTSHHIVFPFNKSTRARLLLSLGIGAGGLKKHEDAVGLDQVFRSASGENNSGFRRAS
ncbi:hypothetical protein DM02DRAFT_614947 [Periconia macrospinosa]|uniref:Uncharacterized protein n=1 Tax=Periconia macrospinosa TaxID=97972 RepID=A0A2V1DN09_9PLEO|nr:hypothetical protein DM02DRAFT_614947 [Periconia macrospinosa]